MCKVNSPASTNGELILIKIWVFELIGREGVIVYFRIVIQMLLEIGDPLF